MKYDQEIEREIELEADDLVALFNRRESIDGGTRVFIRPTEMLHALAKLDPIPPGEQERLREEHGSGDITIQSVLMEDEDE